MYLGRHPGTVAYTVVVPCMCAHSQEEHKVPGSRASGLFFWDRTVEVRDSDSRIQGMISRDQKIRENQRIRGSEDQRIKKSEKKKIRGSEDQRVP